MRLIVKGPPCPRCGQPTEVREHKAVTAKELARPFYYSRWYNCANRSCRATLIMPEEFKVFSVREPRPDPDTPGDVIWDDRAAPVSTRPATTFGDFSRAYREQCAKDDTEPECPF